MEAKKVKRCKPCERMTARRDFYDRNYKETNFKNKDEKEEALAELMHADAQLECHRSSCWTLSKSVEK